MAITKERIYELLDAAQHIQQQYLELMSALAIMSSPNRATSQTLEDIHYLTSNAQVRIANAQNIIMREDLWRKLTKSRNEYAKRRAETKRRQQGIPVQKYGEAARNAGRLMYETRRANEAVKSMHDSSASWGDAQILSMTSEDDMSRYPTLESCPPQYRDKWLTEEAKAQALLARIQSNQHLDEFDAPRLRGEIGFANQHVLLEHHGDLQGKLVICECHEIFETIDEWIQHVRDSGMWSEQQITRSRVDNVPEDVRYPEDDPTFAILGGIIQESSDSPEEEPKS